MTIEQTILSASEIRRGSRTYYLPPIDGSFRVAASQIRALNLVSALAKVHGLGAADEVAVGGGEIQGMTAAAALARLGCKVHIFDRYGQLGNDVRLSNRYVQSSAPRRANARAKRRADSRVPCADRADTGTINRPRTFAERI